MYTSISYTVSVRTHSTELEHYILGDNFISRV